MPIDRRSFLSAALGGLFVPVVPLSAHANEPEGDERQMVASWYGEEFAGRLMANGKPFDPSDPTIAAHRTLPFGTRIALFHPENGTTHEVIVQDRGPFVKGRDLDLSHAAAKELDFLQEGTALLSATIIA